MGLMAAIVFGMLTVLGAICAKILADEFKAWAPMVANKIVAAAVQALPSELRGRFSEEWQSHINDVPGDVGKIVVACGFLFAALRLTNEPFGLGKRVFDVVVVSLFLVFIAPSLALAVVLVKINSAGSIFVRQTRIGRGGKPFQVTRFRTRSDNGKKRRGARAAIGSLLRAARIDAVPELFCVLSGKMSLVGPRPLTDGADLGEQAKLPCRPGVTGPWAFGTKDSASYLADWSFNLDVKIILASVGVVLLDKSRQPTSAADFERAYKIGSLAVGVSACLLVSAPVLVMLL